jgi:class 3 adenylate cyclase
MGEQPHTSLFADIDGFTAPAEAHGDREVADVAAELATAVCRRSNGDRR